MKTKLLIIICSLIASFVPSMAANYAQMADSAYNKEAYTRAIELYNKALSETGRNADIYYNLGNAYYRQGKVAQAVLAYERALRINPSFEEARANLKFVNSRLEDKPEDNNSLLTRTHDNVIAMMSADAWAWVAFAAFAVLCGLIAVYIFSSNIAVRKFGFFAGIVMIFITLYFIVVAADAANRLNDHSEAIVTVPSTLLNSVPRQPKQTEKVVPLHEGTKVQIVDSVATPDDSKSPRWYNVRIGGGSTVAWLRATDVERI